MAMALTMPSGVVLGIRRAYSAYRRRALERRIARILARADAPDCTASERAFDELQRAWPGIGAGYGYDAVSTWKRGAQRAMALLALDDRLRDPGCVLEAACGDGMTAALLAHYGHEVALADAEDWRDARASALPFIKGDLASPGLLPERHFDLIYSYNAFEHFDDPAAVLRTLVAAAKPGGLIFLEFGPLYCGPWGLHAYRTLKMPYPQFLFSETFVERHVARLGISDLGSERTTLQPVNRWRLAQFRALFEQCGCELVRCDVVRVDPELLRIIRRFPKAFQGRGLSLDDVRTQALTVLLRTPSS